MKRDILSIIAWKFKDQYKTAYSANFQHFKTSQKNTN